jgi:hypothetical protein
MQGVHLEILPQPNDTTCGPTCLQAVYGYYGDHVPLEQVIDECPRLEEGGTLAPLLARHAQQRGYRATIFAYNLNVFDPVWFDARGNAVADIREKLLAQIEAKDRPRLRRACEAYVDFLHRGGQLRMEDLTPGLLRRHLSRAIPILTGLSSTFLYRAAREIGPLCAPDDVRGLPTGHFVVLCGYDRARKLVRIADPYLPNPLAPQDHYYTIDVDRVVCAILLGALTYDANLLILQPGRRKGMSHGDADRRE